MSCKPVQYPVSTHFCRQAVTSAFDPKPTLEHKALIVLAKEAGVERHGRTIQPVPGTGRMRIY
jgi:hypothetical protein